MSTSSIEFVVHPAFFLHITCYYHTYTTDLGRKNEVTLSRVIGIIMRKFALENLVSKFWVTISMCSINKGDIIRG